MSCDHKLFFEKDQVWLGQGVINFSMTCDQLKFYARWSCSETADHGVLCRQEIEIDGVMDRIENQFEFHDLLEGRFVVALENPVWGNVKGKGLIDQKTIAWEFFRQESGYEGLEVYEKLDTDQYLLRAEYMSPDLYRTQIEGEVWKK